MKGKRRLFFRIGMGLVLIGIAALMFVIGRGHTVYFDNKALEYNGQTVASPYKIEVYVNGEEKPIAKLRDDERGMTPWTGQSFKMEVEVTKDKGGSSTRQAVSMKLPYDMDGVVINIPALLAGLPRDAYLSEFVSAVPDEPAEEETMTDEFGIELKDMGESTEELPEQ